MFDVSTINNLYGVVGLKQPFDPTYAILDTDNQISRSGYYSNSSNPYVKIRSIKNTQDFIGISDTQFNELLADNQKNAINEVCNSVFDEPDFRERNLVYQYAMNKVNTTSLPDGFACYKIVVNKENNIALKINRLILDFEGIGDITVRLYSSQQTTPLFEQIVSITSPNQEIDLGWELNNLGVNYKAEYYLGYTVNPALKPFKRDYERSNITTCFRDFSIDDRIFKNHSVSTIPDLTTDDGISDYIGINPDVTVYDDYTDLILREERLFAKAIDLQFQINLMRIYLGSLRSNSDERYSKDLFNKILVHIEGLNETGSIRIVGVKEKLTTEIHSIRKQIKKIKEGLFGGLLKSKTIV